MKTYSILIRRRLHHPPFYSCFSLKTKEIYLILDGLVFTFSSSAITNFLSSFLPFFPEHFSSGQKYRLLVNSLPLADFHWDALSDLHTVIIEDLLALLGVLQVGNVLGHVVTLLQVEMNNN